jgi:hypothetical protein
MGRTACAPAQRPRYLRCTWSAKVAAPPYPDVMRPDNLIVMYLAGRGMRLWGVARALCSAVVALAGANPLHLGFPSSALIVGACVALGLADIRRRHERVLLANLAVPGVARAAFFAVLAFMGESAVAAVASMLR